MCKNVQTNMFKSIKTKVINKNSLKLELQGTKTVACNSVYNNEAGVYCA